MGSEAADEGILRRTAALRRHGFSETTRAADLLRAAPSLLVAIAVLASGALLLVLESRVTFIFDDWTFLLYRRGVNLSVLLDPHNEHIVVAPVTIYKLLQVTFGMDSARPYQVVSDLLFLTASALLFVYLRRRVGGWLAFFGALVVLFLGSGWLDLLWSFQMGFSGSLAAGIGMLLALDRDDPAGDRLACLLLGLSLSFSSLGLAFGAAALVELALNPRPRRQRAYFALAPLGLYALWWLGWGHTADTSVSFDNVLHSPEYVYDAISQVLASLTGLARPSDGDPTHLGGLGWGHRLFFVVLAAATFRVVQLRSAPRGLLVAVAAGAAFWFLAAFNDQILRGPTNLRYQLPGAVFALMIGAELLRDVRPRARTLAVVGAVVAAAVASNVDTLRQGAEKFMRPKSQLVRAQLTGLDLTRGTVAPNFVVSLDQFGFVSTTAALYFQASDDHGSPAFTPAELAGASPRARALGDETIAAADRIRLAPPIPPSGARNRGCRRLSASAPVRVGADLRAGGAVVLRAGGPRPVKVRLGRFSRDLPVELGSLTPGVARGLRLPADQSPRPWLLGLQGEGQVAVCAAGSA